MFTVNDTGIQPGIPRQGGLSATTNIPGVEIPLDAAWARNAFLISGEELRGHKGPATAVEESYINSVARFYTTAYMKFTDSRIGGNIYVNPRPQSTRYADVRIKGRVNTRVDVGVSEYTGDNGMGHNYSETLDDHARIVHIRCGVPEFNSMTNFLSQAFDAGMANMARTGKTLSWWRLAGQAVGSYTKMVAFPGMTLGIFALKMIDAIWSEPTSKFYKLRPSMYMYWSSVQSIVNALAVNSGIMPAMLSDAPKGGRMGTEAVIDPVYLEALHTMMPDVFMENGGGVNIYHAATRAQRIKNLIEVAEARHLNNADGSDDFTGFYRKMYATDVSTEEEKSLGMILSQKLLMSDYHQNHSSEDPQPGGKSTPKIQINPLVDQSNGANPNAPGGSGAPTKPTTEESINSRAAYLDAEFRHGSQFVSFSFDDTGAASESFSNSFTESDISQFINSKSSDIRSTKFSVAGGNIADGIVADTLEGAISAASSFAGGVLSSMTYGVSDIIGMLANGGYIDIPKHWQSSSADLPRLSYSTTLIAPYNNSISRLQNLYIPMACLLAMAAPLSTGKQSYTSPFLCEVYDRGRGQSRLCAVQSLSFSRGVSNMPFNHTGHPLAVDVSISFVDLSSVLHMPIPTANFISQLAKVAATPLDAVVDMVKQGSVTDADNPLTDYLAVVAGQDINSQIYGLPKRKIAIAKSLANFNRFTSPGAQAMLFHETTVNASILWGIVPWAFGPAGWAVGTTVLGSKALDVLAAPHGFSTYL